MRAFILSHCKFGHCSSLLSWLGLWFEQNDEGNDTNEQSSSEHLLEELYQQKQCSSKQFQFVDFGVFYSFLTKK